MSQYTHRHINHINHQVLASAISTSVINRSILHRWVNSFKIDKHTSKHYSKNRKTLEKTPKSKHEKQQVCD